MKNLRWLSFFVVLLGGMVFSFTTEAAPRYWQQYLELLSEKYNRPDLLERYTAANRRRTVSNAYIFSPARYGTPYNPRNRSSSIFNKTWPTPKENHLNNITVSARPIRLNRNILKINETPTDVFELGFFNRNRRNDNIYQEPILIDKATFSIVDNRDISDKYQHLLLTFEDQAFRFDSDGNVTLPFKNLRLAAGDNRSLKVGIKIDDPANAPSTLGSLRLRLEEVTGQLESRGKTRAIIVYGTSISELIAFNPIPKANKKAHFLGNKTGKIYGKMLSTGSEEFVLAVGFRASFDDFFIQKIAITDVLSKNSIDTFVEKIEAIDLETGRPFDAVKFTGGVARFKFPKPILVERKHPRRIGFKVYLKDQIYANHQNTQFRLTVNPSDIIVTSRSNGINLSDSNKIFTLENETFTIANTAPKLIFPTKQTRPLSFTGKKELVHSLDFTSHGGNSSIARISFQVFPNKLAFAGGISADDFELVELDNTRNRQIKPLPSNNSLTGNLLRFDLVNPVDIHERETYHFGLKIALQNTPTLTKQDGITFRIPADNDHLLGTLDEIRASQAHFIWSDQSARPHSQKSADWRNGNQIPGIPTQSVTYKRGS